MNEHFSTFTECKCVSKVILRSVACILHITRGRWGAINSLQLVLRNAGTPFIFMSVSDETVMLHLINPRTLCINFFPGLLLSELFFSWIFPLSFSSCLFFPVSFKYQAFCRSLCAAGAPTSQDSALLNDRLSTTLYPPPSSLALHTQNEHPVQSLSPIILPSIHLPTHPILSSCLVSRNTGQKQMTQWLPFFLLLPPSSSLLLSLFKDASHT